MRTIFLLAPVHINKLTHADSVMVLRVRHCHGVRLTRKCSSTISVTWLHLGHRRVTGKYPFSYVLSLRMKERTVNDGWCLSLTRTHHQVSRHRFGNVRCLYDNNLDFQRNGKEWCSACEIFRRQPCTLCFQSRVCTWLHLDLTTLKLNLEENVQREVSNVKLSSIMKEQYVYLYSTMTK